MPKFGFRKLVRDRIVEHQIASGAVPEWRVLDDAEHKSALVAKIIEEASEILGADAKAVAGEIADVQQALDDLKAKYGLSDADIATAQQIKKAKNGGFERGVYVESVELSETHEWAGYYRENADRYPEIE
jgi:predicted house-cleaning noncanonical NTP pyrophosphatase (MazG superfamily)